MLTPHNMHTKNRHGAVHAPVNMLVTRIFTLSEHTDVAMRIRSGPVLTNLVLCGNIPTPKVSTGFLKSRHGVVHAPVNILVTRIFTLSEHT